MLNCENLFKRFRLKTLKLDILHKFYDDVKILIKLSNKKFGKEKALMISFGKNLHIKIYSILY